MDAHIVLNTDVKQKNSSHAVVIAISHRAIFNVNEEEDLTLPSTAGEILSQGSAFPFIKAVQTVNEKLLKKNPEETLLFDMILICDDHISDRRSKIVNSVKHYGLEISRFCFCTSESFTSGLLSCDANLFLSTHIDDIVKAQEKGVLSAVLYRQGNREAIDRLKVLFVGDTMGLPEDTTNSDEFSVAQPQTEQINQSSLKELVRLMGEMRRRFGPDDSPLRTCLITVWSPKDMCARALKTLRHWGLEVEEAFCLAGAPQNPILAQIQPHILFGHGLHHLQGVLAAS